MLEAKGLKARGKEYHGAARCSMALRAVRCCESDQLDTMYKPPAIQDLDPHHTFQRHRRRSQNHPYSTSLTKREKKAWNKVNTTSARIPIL